MCQTCYYADKITPTPILPDKTPYGLIFSKFPFNKPIKVFGCLSYACTNDHGRSKFYHRGRQCVYLGNSFTSKGYILLDINTKQLFVSRDVLFVEHIFPFKEFLITSSISSASGSSSFLSSLVANGI